MRKPAHTKHTCLRRFESWLVWDRGLIFFRGLSRDARKEDTRELESHGVEDVEEEEENGLEREREGCEEVATGDKVDRGRKRSEGSSW